MKKILVIEDEDIVRENIIEMLRNENFDPVGAKDGEQGFKLANSVDPDLIISDIRMPKMDGIQLIKRLQANLSTAQIPFIFLTAKVEMQDMREGMTNGADDYLTKPFSYDDLLNAINSRLKKKENHLRMIKDFRELVLRRVPHELRTPLVGILGLSDIMKENMDGLSKEEIVKMAGMIYSSGSRLHRRIEKFLAFSELLQQNNLLDDAGDKTEFDLIPEQISDFLLTKSTQWKRDDDIDIQLEKSMLKITKPEYEMILNELLENSLKFSDPDTLISIAGKNCGEYYQTTIIDNGKGTSNITPDDIQLFNQFEEKSSEEGLGLGLSIVKKIINNNNGHFTFKSKEGLGTTVEFKILKSEN